MYIDDININKKYEVIEIKKLDETDFNEYCDIIYRSFSLNILNLPTYEVFMNNLSITKNILYSYKNKENKETIGVCMIEQEYNDNKKLAYLSDFCIDNRYQNKKLGTDFLIKIIDIYKKKNYSELYLEVDIKNEIALKLYTHNGFKIKQKYKSELYYICSYIFEQEYIKK